MPDDEAEDSIFSARAYEFRRKNSREKFTDEDLKGVIPLNVAIDALHRFTARATLGEQADIYQRTVRDLKNAIRETALVKGGLKLLTRKAAKELLSYAKIAWDFASQADRNREMERRIRAQGARGITEIIRQRLFGHKKEKTKTFYSRRGKPTAKPAPPTPAPEPPTPQTGSPSPNAADATALVSPVATISQRAAIAAKKANQK